MLALAEQLDGNLEQAIRRIAASKMKTKPLIPLCYEKKEIVILLCVLFAVAIAAGYLMLPERNLKSNLELLCGK